MTFSDGTNTYNKVAGLTATLSAITVTATQV